MSEPHEVSTPTTMGALIDVVLSTGRIGGLEMAAEIWCNYLVAWWRWDEGAARNAVRTLRGVAESNPIDERTAEYVGEMTTLAITLAGHGIGLGSPREIKEWFHTATRKYHAPEMKPQAAAPQPSKAKTTKDEFYRQLIAGDTTKGKKR